MSTWARVIQYRDFYDVPRIFLLEYSGRLLLFDSQFDDVVEDFSMDYKVFEMPTLSDAELNGSWLDLNQKASSFLGKVDVSHVKFDSTSRQAIDIDTDWFKRLCANL